MNEADNKTEIISDGKRANNTLTDDSVTSAANTTEAKKYPSGKKQTKEAKKKNRKIRSLLQNYFMSRRRFFKMIESKMDKSGLRGRDCMLKAICETAADSFEQHNGLIGSVVDVLFL